ncbi:hypothetical protein [Chryseobacterium taklimakanense]|uniref:Uncharacterized protein n=1 Tax=Chryseobacterium taklimakanense TaxID=536441 RepID=A0A3G8WKB4_9FLAO|nr:hypothetical protein [Chryseobacterium taklimakanense]AZI20658.1 hypothetical protein EIH08_07975 [Chryseobacterium taklimakanense]
MVNTHIYLLNSSIFIYSDENQPRFNRDLLLWNNKTKYNEYITVLKASRFKLATTTVNEYNQVVKIYKNPTKTIQITTSITYRLNDEQFPSWQMLILSNKDFELNF